MNRNLIRLFFLCLLAMFLPSSLAAQETQWKEEPLRSEIVDGKWALPGPEWMEPWGIPQWVGELNEVIKAQVRLKAILLENHESGVGMISRRFNSGSEITHGWLWLAPNSGYVLVYASSCEHAIWEFSHGSFRMTDEWLELVPEGGSRLKAGEKSYFQNFIALKLARVRVRKKEYLIPEEKIEEFGQLFGGVNVSVDPPWDFDRVYGFLHADSVSSLGSDQDPNLFLPSGFEKFARQPVRGSVIAVSKPFVQRFRKGDQLPDGGIVEEPHLGMTVAITFDIGAKRGIKKNMWVYLCVAGEYQPVRIVSVTPRSSRALIEEELLPDDPESVSAKSDRLLKEHPFTVGAPVSTSFFDVPEYAESDSKEKSDQSR